MLSSQPENIKKIRHNFESLGLYDGDTEFEYIDSELDQSLSRFQNDNGLKQDDIMPPKRY